LPNVYGSTWRKRDLGVFSIYIDDSGSAPEHRFAIAAGIVFPAKRILAFEREWNAFRTKEEISELHASECVASNAHSDFAGWEYQRIERVLLRAQEIILKYSVKAFSIGVHKQDYDEIVPKEMWANVGESHYIWALSSVLGLSYDWASQHVVPMEYVLDNAAKQDKRDIREAIDYSDEIYPGHFAGRYSFRSRKETPGLQAADLFAWTGYQVGCNTRFDVPIKSPADKLWVAFTSKNNGEWSTIQSLNRKGLEMWVEKAYNSPEDVRLREYKEKRKEERIPKLKKSKSRTMSPAI
jgi:uncharacterized protein DUF3800